MSVETNRWCRALGIAPPVLEAVAHHPDANTYSLLIVALLERGEPMTLEEVAARFETAGIADRGRAHQSLQRCKPARAPVYREGDRYHLDPGDDEADLWAFRLGLRPPSAAPLTPGPPPSPLPGPEVRLTREELDEAWNEASLLGVSARRLALSVLDAEGGPLTPAEVVASVARRTRWTTLSEESARGWHGKGVVMVQNDGRWAIAEGAQAQVLEARQKVREQIAKKRRRVAAIGDPAAIQASIAAHERRRAVHGTELAGMSRALVVTFPMAAPRAAALLDVGRHELRTYVDDELGELRASLSRYQVIGGVEVRSLLRALRFDPEERRLHELGPPQKTLRLNKAGRVLKLTTALLVQGSCGVSRPFGEPKKLAAYLAAGEETKLRRRLEADVKALYALYEYGRLQRFLRLRWGYLDQRIPAPWVHRDEPTLLDLKKAALEGGVPLQVVIGSAPGWEDPWARARQVRVLPGRDRWSSLLVGEDGYVVPEEDVQRARLVADVPVH